MFVLPRKQAEGSAACVTVVHLSLTQPNEPQSVLPQTYTNNLHLSEVKSFVLGFC